MSLFSAALCAEPQIKLLICFQFFLESRERVRVKDRCHGYG